MGGANPSVLELKSDKDDNNVEVVKVTPLNIGPTVGNYYSTSIGNTANKFQILRKDDTKLKNQSSKNR